MNRRYQQGMSVVGFLIVSVLLAGLLMGGIYAVRHTNLLSGAKYLVASTENDAKPAQKPSTSSDKKDDASTRKQEKNDSTSSDSSSQTKSDDTTKSSDAATKTQQAQNQPPQSSTPSSEPSAPVALPTTPTPTDAQGLSALPRTGPMDVLLPMVGAALLTVASLFYIVSRKSASA